MAFLSRQNKVPPTDEQPAPPVEKTPAATAPSDPASASAGGQPSDGRSDDTTATASAADGGDGSTAAASNGAAPGGVTASGSADTGDRSAVESTAAVDPSQDSDTSRPVDADDAGPSAAETARQAVERLESSWLETQASFLDEPREAVRKTDLFVGDVVDHFHQAITQGRQSIRTRWSDSSLSTDDLREVMRDYRSLIRHIIESAELPDLRSSASSETGEKVDESASDPSSAEAESADAETSSAEENASPGTSAAG